MSIPKSGKGSQPQNKLPWYPQQPKGCIFTNLSAACCEAASIHLSLVSVSWKAAQAFSRTFSGTLLNLTWLYTKASRNLLRNPVAPDLALHQSLPELLRNLRNLLRNLALHQSLPDLCWTWPGSAPKPPRPSPEPLEPSSEPGFAPKPPRPLLNLTWLGTKASQTFSGTFAGTFSGTLLNVSWLCTKTSQTFSGTSLNLTRHLHQCTPELFWAEDPISLRCWESE